MTKLWVTSDLHLGHKNICKYRTEFETPEEHNEILWDNLASTVGKRDTIFFLGDITFDRYWLQKIRDLQVKHKLLIGGNHDTERGITMGDLCLAYDSVKAMTSHKNYWLTHCPIHPQELRGRLGNIHGHLHGNMVLEGEFTEPGMAPIDKRYLNVCVEHSDYKPVLWEELTGINQ